MRKQGVLGAAVLAALLIVAATALAATSKRTASALRWEAGSGHFIYAGAPQLGHKPGIVNTSDREYAYAPSVVDLGGSKADYFTCHSWNDFGDAKANTVDHIGLLQMKDGHETRSILFGNNPAGVPKTGNTHTWDGFHNCDPSVLALPTSLSAKSNKPTDKYVMFFTGNDQNTVDNNGVGLAVSKSLTSGWTRLPKPLVSAPGLRNGKYPWGSGQPTAVALGGAKVLLCYTDSLPVTHGVCEVLSLTHAAHPVVITKPWTIATSGLGQKTLNNFDIALSQNGQTVYMVAGKFNPQKLSEEFVASIPLTGFEGRKRASWHILGVLGSGQTGMPRNSNAGLARTVTGRMPSESQIRVVTTTWQSSSRFSSALFSLAGKL